MPEPSRVTEYGDTTVAPRLCHAVHDPQATAIFGSHDTIQAAPCVFKGPIISNLPTEIGTVTRIASSHAHMYN